MVNVVLNELFIFADREDEGPAIERLELSMV